MEKCGGWDRNENDCEADKEGGSKDVVQPVKGSDRFEGDE